MDVSAKFNAALEELIEEIKEDRTVLAAILCGSLSHDVVWARSDIDLALITVDDKGSEPGGIALNANGVNVHAFLMPRASFRKTIEGSLRNSFMHSLFAKGRVLFSHDESITELCARLNELGDRDTQVQLLAAAGGASACLNKARKWLVTRGDLAYAALWILHAAGALARIEVLSSRKLADREVLPQALALNPDTFGVIYSQLLNAKKTQKAVENALGVAERYLAERAILLGRPVLEYLAEAGEARSASEMEAHFKRNFDVHDVTTLCEYLADQGHITKVSAPAQLTRRSNIQVQELAFVYLDA